MKLRVKELMVRLASQLENKCRKCNDDICLKQVEKKLSKLTDIKDKLDKRMNELDSKFNEEYYLCRDMIFENDIRICRLDVMKKFV
jgi:hypothetical protein